MAYAGMLQEGVSHRVAKPASPADDAAGACIVAASALQQAHAIRTLTLAFAADPVARWVYPNPRQFHEQFPRMLRAMGGPAFAGGTAWIAGGGAGAALWLAPGVMPDEQRIVEQIERSVEESHRPQVYALMAAMDEHHPAEPHWYLPMIGVEPHRQGQGIGSTLLQHMAARLDQAGQVAYLESSNPANVPLYQRHGFEPTGIIRAPGSPLLCGMIRRPR